MEKIELTINQLKNLLHCATGNVKDFVMDNDGFIKEWLENKKITMSKTNTLTSHHPERNSHRVDKMSGESKIIKDSGSMKFLKRFTSKKRRNYLKNLKNEC